ncbi:MAG: hypothetical protein P8N09_13790 [Planctomycetota bacterium]|nr:hypothetical protein [Planctomycetota bacterium]
MNNSYKSNKMSGSFALAPLLVLAGGISALAQESPQVLVHGAPVSNNPSEAEVTDPLHDLKEAFFEAQLPAEQLKALGLLQSVIYEGNLSSEITMDGLHFLGHSYYGLGEWDTALETFGQMAANPDAREETLDALRMVGQIELLGHGNLQAAELAYREVIERSWTRVNTATSSLQVLALEQEAATQLAGMMLKSGRYTEAMAFADQALANARENSDLDAVESLSLIMARATSALGMHADSRSWFAAVSTSKRAEGDASWIQLERELAHALPTVDETIAVLASIWQSEGLLDEPGYYVAAHELSGLLLETGQELAAIEVLDSIAKDLGSRFAGVGENISRSTVNIIHEDTLLTLAMESEALGDIRGQHAYLREFVTLFPTSPRLDHAQEHIPALRELLNRR